KRHQKISNVDQDALIQAFQSKLLNIEPDFMKHVIQNKKPSDPKEWLISLYSIVDSLTNKTAT
ncbi:hypothetical protein ACI4BE_27780, partial [Klebsiella pneumoniae]|uniref:hypothetical protein n=1 Tax=Klebsiella pneumoniae TaxID=573 RepID=UPI003854FBBE